MNNQHPPANPAPYVNHTTAHPPLEPTISTTNTPETFPKELYPAAYFEPPNVPRIEATAALHARTAT